jgi:hypothetical protein
MKYAMTLLPDHFRLTILYPARYCSLNQLNNRVTHGAVTEPKLMLIIPSFRSEYREGLCHIFCSKEVEETICSLEGKSNSEIKGSRL